MDSYLKFLFIYFYHASNAGRDIDVKLCQTVSRAGIGECFIKHFPPLGCPIILVSKIW